MPEFLSGFKPEGETLNFEEEEEPEYEDAVVDASDNAGDTWGGDNNGAVIADNNAQDAWGASNGNATNTGAW